MARRFQSAADYAAIAVAPLLIFMMLSSLAGFLVVLLYSGSYPQRVAWTLLMYTMGTVAIARVTIENDRQYSMMYTLALGAAALVTMLRFVGDPIFSVLILVLIGYLADRIVHDCTLVDDSVDSSGQGLIDRMTNKTVASTATQSQGQSGHQPGRTVLKLALGALPLFGIGQFFLRGDTASWQQARWFLTLYLFSSLSLLVVTSFLNLRRYLRQRQTEMPTDATLAWLIGGVAMIAIILGIAYLAPMPGRTVASMRVPEFLKAREPLTSSEFGWGDEGAPQPDNDSKDESKDPQNTAGGRRNDPQSPPDDAAPQSQATQPGAPPGGKKGDRKDGPAGDQSGGKQSGGESKTKDEQKASGGSSKSKPKDGGESKQSSKSKSPDKSSNNKQQSSEGEKSQADKSSTEPESNDQSASGADRKPQAESRSQANKESPQESDQSSKGSSTKNADEETNRSQTDEGDADTHDAESPTDEKSANENESKQNPETEPESDAKSNSESESEQQPAPPAQPDQKGEPPSPNDSSSLAAMGSWITSVFRWIVFAVLAAIVAIYLYLYIDTILAWIHRLLGGDDVNEPVSAFKQPIATTPRTPPRPFASFRNPIGRAEPSKVIVVTFDALEAWCRERGVTRTADETPTEFVRRVGGQFPNLAATAPVVVDAYNRIVYGRQSANDRDVQAASAVWQTLTR